MTITEVVELAAEKVGADPKLFWGFAQSLVQAIASELEDGHDIKIQGLGTFYWAPVPARKLPQGTVVSGFKLKFKPAKRFDTRRMFVGVDLAKGEDCTAMTKVTVDEEGMTKYAVVTDIEKTKTASKKSPGQCPDCNKALDSGGACPSHGTEPFEPKKEG
jgi:nucleoid DNA-binding protein